MLLIAPWVLVVALLVYVLMLHGRLRRLRGPSKSSSSGPATAPADEIVEVEFIEVVDEPPPAPQAKNEPPKRPMPNLAKTVIADLDEAAFNRVVGQSHSKRH